MDLTLVDREPSVVAELSRAFGAYPEVRVVCDGILNVADNTVVSPANSYGYMDGGIDREYVDFFGQGLQQRVQRAIDRVGDGMLPVGTAVLVETGHARIPYLIATPTMELPGPTQPAKIFFAMAALLNAVQRHSSKVTRVFCPGLGTGVGAVAPDVASTEMAAAYGKWKARSSLADGRR